MARRLKNVLKNWICYFIYYRTCPLSPELLCLEWELWELEPLLVFEELRECPLELVTWLAEGVVLSWATFTSSSCSKWFWFDSDAASSFSKPLMDGMSANVSYIWLIVSGIIIIIRYYELMQVLVCGTSSAKERVTNNRSKRVSVTRIKHMLLR